MMKQKNKTLKILVALVALTLLLFATGCKQQETDETTQTETQTLVDEDEENLTVVVTQVRGSEQQRSYEFTIGLTCHTYGGSNLDFLMGEEEENEFAQRYGFSTMDEAIKATEKHPPLTPDEFVDRVMAKCPEFLEFATGGY